jgi:L-2-hydroxycarboxylate dehydrogenase (NAD+)
VKKQMIGITGTNARPSIAPTFGVENMLGTNPLTFGMPTDEDFPFLLDCATSITQRGKIELYARNGKKMPAGWVIDENGNTETDSGKALDDLVKGRAALNPLGGAGEETAGYKGYGYATVVEILSSALQQGAYLKMLLGIKDGKKVPYNLGHFFIAIDISSFTEPSSFMQTTGNILRELRSARKAPGHKKIYTAGEKEYITMMERKDKGVPFSKGLVDEFRRLCKDYDLSNYLEYFEV